MNELAYWQQKLVQLVHDPALKALYLASRTKHTAPVAALFEALTGVTKKYALPPADYAATGADRPVFPKGVGVTWRKLPIVTHPLQPGARVLAQGAERFQAPGVQQRLEEASGVLEAYWKGLADELHPDADPADGAAAVRESTWKDVKQLRTICLLYWRTLRDASYLLDLHGELLPADTRCPDHSLYDHARMASALAFLPTPRKTAQPDPARTPVMVSFQVHGVQDFIRRSRKSRDLWTACMIYGELVWAAMEVVVEHYGPEAVLYPDLLGNPYMDQWLIRQGLGSALPKPRLEHGAGTRAVPLPHSFALLVPRGGADADHLLPVEELMSRCTEAVRERWQTLGNDTAARLGDKEVLGGNESAWRPQFDAQIASRTPRTSWTVVRWEHRLRDLPERPANLRGLPAIDGGDEVPSLLEDRKAALRPYTSREAWHHHDLTHYLFWGENVGYLKSERGFDYPLVHGQLLALHSTTKASASPQPSAEQGAICMITGTEAALGGAPPDATLTEARRAADRLWGRAAGRSGEVERLGGPGAMKRYLAQAGRKRHNNVRGLVERWHGVRPLSAGVPRPSDKDVTAPFPSTAAIAASRFLAYVCANRAALDSEIVGFVDAVDNASPESDREGAEGVLERNTQHPRALPHCHRYGSDPLIERFVRTEAQYLSPDAVRARDRSTQWVPGGPLGRVCAAAQRLQAKVTELTAGPSSEPEVRGEQYAIIAVDVDRISRLVSGDPAALHTTWRDILHPELVAGEKLSSAWRAHLGRKRNMGPALHALITRALADFTYEIVPWVVEREFHGRVIYAGGDDALVMAPADEALAIAARLQQLLSAPWVLDTAPGTPADYWAPGDEAHATDRFRIPAIGAGSRGGGGSGGTITMDSCRWEPVITRTGMRIQESDASHALLAATDDSPGRMRLFPMLGRRTTLSAGIAFGHFKTPLQMVLDAAMRNQRAVKSRGGGGFGISRFTASGLKYTFTASWSLGQGGRPAEGSSAEARRTGPPTASEALRLLQKEMGQTEGGLSARVAHELRDQIALVAGAHLLDPPEASGFLGCPQPRDDGDAEREQEAQRRLAAQLRALVRSASQVGDRRLDARVDGLPGTLAELVAAVLIEGAGSPRQHPADFATAAVSGLQIVRSLCNGGDRE